MKTYLPLLAAWITIVLLGMLFGRSIAAVLAVCIPDPVQNMLTTLCAAMIVASLLMSKQSILAKPLDFTEDWLVTRYKKIFRVND